MGKTQIYSENTLKGQFYMYLRSRGFTQLFLCSLLQVCFPCLCSSEHSRLGLDLLHVIIHLKDNTYWLVKVTYQSDLQLLYSEVCT